MVAPQALIKDLEGEVSVSRQGEVISVKAGDYLLPGDEVVTGATGRMALEFPAGEGQIPAAGLMTSNGRLTLAEQTSPQGQQMVVIEDGECFEFTSELAENSAAADGAAVSGLFGAGLLAAGGGTAAGLGAVAAGAFLAGGSDDSSESGPAGAGTASPTTGTASNNGNPLGNLNPPEFSSEQSPQSPEAFAEENLTEDNLSEDVLQPVEEAIQNSQENPESTPDNAAAAGEQLTLAGLDNLNDALVAFTGEGTPQADLVQQLVDGVNQTPLGGPLSPLTQALTDAVNTDLGLDTLQAALPDVNLADGGLVTSVVDTVAGVIQPVSQEVAPVGQLVDGLRELAVQVDSGLEGLLGPITSEIPAPDGLAGSGLPTGLPSGLPAELPPELTSALPPEVQGGLDMLTDGILGGVDTLQTALQGAGSGSGLPEIPEGDLLGTLSSGISSGADALGGALPNLPTDGLTG